METRESSVASSTDFYETEAPVAAAAAVAKRKADDASALPGKKRKPNSPCTIVSSDLRSCARLPQAVWQHIFLFCSLADLGRLMQVNRPFFSYLTDVRNVSVSRADVGCLRLLKSESIWASARNALSPRPPKPLVNFTELQMWQLAWSKRCQFCNKSSSFTPGDKIWQHGPSDTGLRTVWPFGIRACGSCLLEKSQTDSSLLFSAASALRPALPFALITKHHHYIPAHLLQTAAVPPDVEIGKYYYKVHVAEMTEEMDQAISLGSAAAEEWSKGLEARGKERMKVAENWEKWEAKYRPEPRRVMSPRPSPIIHTPVPVGKYHLDVPIVVQDSTPLPRFKSTTPVRSLTDAAPTPQHAHARPPTVPPQVFTPQPGHSGSTQPSHQRNIHDANEAKAGRKADIERRCQQMDPPIPPNLLRHMDSYKAALQISQPMNDYAWTLLKPRLLAQLPAAQQAEAEHVAHVNSLATKPTDRRYQDVNSKEAKEIMDREWDEAQRPIRDKLNSIADDFINHELDHGKAVTYENSPKVAADLLTHTRRTYLASEGDVQQVNEAYDATNHTFSKPKLVLENMKWVYDNKIKPLTEQFRKELYLCNYPNCESGFRYYGFEGVVQHYGAKHTHAFSNGNVVVAWRDAEWPEEPPFHPDPVSVMQAYHTSNPSGHGFFPAYSRAGTSTPHMPIHFPQASPGPYNYAGHYAGPFPPPQPPGSSVPGYEYGQPYGASMDGYTYPAMAPPGYPNPMGPGFMTSPAPGNPAVPPPPVIPHMVQNTGSNLADVTEDSSHSTSAYDKQVSTVIDMAQDVWKHTAGIKDMFNSLRVYILLHRVITGFHQEFQHEPNLSHFIDAFSSHEVPKSLKNAPGLSCKTCQVESSHQLTGAYYAKPMDRKTFTVSALLSHFRTQHSSPQQYNYTHGHQASTPDWKEDMIELPSERIISGLIHAPGMDDDKLLMIARVFPSLFPRPLPKIGRIDNNGMISPSASDSKDEKDAPSGSIVPQESRDQPSAAPPGLAQVDPSNISEPLTEESDPERPALPTHDAAASSSSGHKQRASRETPAGERRQLYYEEPRYYTMDDGYGRQREYIDYDPSPRIVHAGPAYGEYSGRRTVFRERERVYGPPGEDVMYTHPREGSHGREYGAYSRQARFYEDDDPQLEYRYVREPQLHEESLPHAQSAADRFLDDLAGEASKPAEPTQTETIQSATEQDVEQDMPYTPLPPTAPNEDEPGLPHRQMAAPHPKAPSTVSNGSRYEDYHPNGRHLPTSDLAGPPRRAGPQRRRDRPHEYRMPSRYYRYMSVAREDPYGRGPSMSRSQSRRYEEQRRRIDQQETPQPHADHDYEPAYSRDHSVDHPSPEDGVYRRPSAREYVSVQDRLHPYSPPRYRYDEPHRPPPVYFDEYGHPVHGYEVVRVRGDPRHSRAPYVPYPPAARYEQERYEYVPVQYERPPQRYNSRGEYVYVEERERALPRRPVPEAEPESYEAPPREIKVESAPHAIPEGP